MDGPRRTSITLSRLPTAPARARRYLRPRLRALAFPEDVLDEILVAVGEAVTNAVLYGAPAPGSPGPDRISVTLRVEDTCVVIGVTSPRTGWTAGPVTRPEPTAIRGRGLFVIDRYTDAWQVTQGPDGTTVHLSRRLPFRTARTAGRTGSL